MVDFVATEDQLKALEQIRGWLRIESDEYCEDEGCPQYPTKHICNPKARIINPSAPFFTLKGYAGTGKSFSILELVRGTFKPHEVCFTAPTNKAVKVLRNYLDQAGLSACTTKTIYSLLGLSLRANGEVKEITKPEEPVDLSGYKLIIVDEGSMVNQFLLSAIEDAYSDWQVPFLFMGDPAQIPPVGEITSPIWKIASNAELTKVLRYGNSILDLATAIRTVVDHPFPALKIVESPPVYVLPKPAFRSKIAETIPEILAGEAKVIAWRNVTTEEYNTFIRREIFGFQEAKANPWLPTDKIVATAHLKDLEDNTFMRTDEEAVVLQVAVGSHPYYQEFEIFNLLVELENGRKATCRVLTPKAAFELQNRLNEISMEAKGGKKYLWGEFWKLKEAFHEIKHSYAITTHRSQGSSYRKVFVDREDILLNRNRPEAFRSLYVAVTRAREEVNIG